MRKTFILLLSSIVIFLGSCSVKTNDDLLVGTTPSEDHGVTPTSNAMSSPATSEATHIDENGLLSTPISTTTPDYWICWDWVWSGYEFGRVREIAESPSNILWVLHDNGLVRLAPDGMKRVFDLREMLGCEECMEIINGTLAISPDGNAWVGLSTGLLIIDKTGEWKTIATDVIVPQLEHPLEAYVLLTDKNGNIWVRIRNNLCSYDGKEWGCQPVKLRFESDRIMSAVMGQDDQIWFGTYEGEIIQFDQNEFLVIDVPEKDFQNIRSLAFDHQTNTLWAVSSSVSKYQEVNKNYPSKILQRTADGSLIFHETSLFLWDGSACDPPLFTSVAITPDGIVWVGMFFCHNLIYYDGVNWKGLDGTTLPYANSEETEKTQENQCGLFGGYIVNVFVAEDGRLLFFDQGGDVLTNNIDFWK